MGESACFDCGKVGDAEKPLYSVTVSPEVRQTSRGKIMPPAGSIALCDGCFAKEVGAKRNA